VRPPNFHLAHVVSAEPFETLVARACEQADRRVLAASGVAINGCVRCEVSVGVSSLPNRVLYELCNGKSMRNPDNRGVPPPGR
jgi:hypothetical protein